VTEKRVCACRGVIEAQADQHSIAHAVRVHYAQPEHQEYVAALEVVEAQRPSIDIAVRNGWAGVTAGLRRVS
jgi:hypothetical protein